MKASFLRTFCAVAMCSVALAGRVMADTPKRIEVPAGELVAALEALSRQAAVDLVFQPDQLRAFHTEGVKGEYTAEGAIRILLKGTPLQ